MAPFVEGFEAKLLGLGYTAGTVGNMLKEVGRLGRWMDRENVAVGGVDAALIDAFRGDLRAVGVRRVPSVRSFEPLVDYLRSEGVLAGPDAPSAPVDVLMGQYRRWLLVDRGLADPTVLRYEKLARRFLVERVSEDDEGFVVRLTGADVIAFLLRESSRVSVGRPRAGWPSCVLCCGFCI